jgi:hypothetical protein
VGVADLLEALVLLAAQPWAPLGAPGGGDVRFAHLTNTCVGAEAPGFDESACVFALHGFAFR